jgi:molybdopterin synthase catalytic subunit
VQAIKNVHQHIKETIANQSKVTNTIIIHRLNKVAVKDKILNRIYTLITKNH